MDHCVADIATRIRHHIFPDDGCRTGTVHRFGVRNLQVVNIRTHITKCETNCLERLCRCGSGIGGGFVTCIQVSGHLVHCHIGRHAIVHLQCLQEFITCIAAKVGNRIITVDDNRTVAFHHVTVRNGKFFRRCTIVIQGKAKSNELGGGCCSSRSIILCATVVGHHLKFTRNCRHYVVTDTEGISGRYGAVAGIRHFKVDDIHPLALCHIHIDQCSSRIGILDAVAAPFNRERFGSTSNFSDYLLRADIRADETVRSH